ncbi:MAG: calcium-binding protein [Arenibacterium sp.]
MDTKDNDFFLDDRTGGTGTGFLPFSEFFALGFGSETDGYIGRKTVTFGGFTFETGDVDFVRLDVPADERYRLDVFAYHDGPPDPITGDTEFNLEVEVYTQSNHVSPIEFGGVIWDTEQGFGTFSYELPARDEPTTYIIGLGPPNAFPEIGSYKIIVADAQDPVTPPTDPDTCIEGTPFDDRLQPTADVECFDGLDGNDRLDFQTSNEGVVVHLGNGTGRGGFAEGDSFASFERVTGSAFDDTLTGDSSRNVLEGLRGSDSLFGEGGRDRLLGGQNKDELFGGNGQDRLIGGSGQDTLNGGAKDDTLFGGSGNDTLNGDSGDDELSGEGGKDTLRGGKDDDTLLGGGKGDTLEGGSGEDSLLGEKGNDTLNGGGDDDLLFGGKGNDTLNGNSGKDELYGEAGDDTLMYSSGNDLMDGGQGFDTASFAMKDNDFSLRFLAGANETWTVDDSGDVIASLESIEKIVGTNGKDKFRGLNDNLVIEGGDGRDEFFSGLGINRLDGGAGVDLFSLGLAERDVVTGGAGSDRFAFGSLEALKEGAEFLKLDDLVAQFPSGGPREVIITDFDDGNEHDRLTFGGFGDIFASEEDVYNAARQDGLDMVIDAGELRIVFQNYSVSDFVSSVISEDDLLVLI